MLLPSRSPSAVKPRTPAKPRFDFTHFLFLQMHTLEIKDLYVSLTESPEKSIVKGLNLTIKAGEVHAVMGPNGTGKSTFSKAIAGHPDYVITGGDVLLDGQSIL